MILDVTTSTVAEGKLMVALNKGEHVPRGLDRRQATARPRPIPKDFYDGGALLTIGAHKGSGLSIVTDLLAGAVTTGRSSDPDDTVLRNNMLSIFIAPAVYDADGGVAREATALRRLREGVAAGEGRASRCWRRATSSGATRARGSRAACRSTTRRWADLLAAATSVGIDAQARAALSA